MVFKVSKWMAQEQRHVKVKPQRFNSFRPSDIPGAENVHANICKRWCMVDTFFRKVCHLLRLSINIQSLSLRLRTT